MAPSIVCTENELWVSVTGPCANRCATRWRCGQTPPGSHALLSL